LPTSQRAVAILPRSRRTLTRRRLLAVAVAVIGAWVSYAVYAATTAGHALDGRVRALQKENAALHQQVDLRKRELTSASSGGWLEEEARRLGYVRPGDRIFVLASPGARLPADGGVDPGPLPGAPSPAPRPAAPAPAAPPTAAAPPPAAATPGPTPLQFTVPRR
jgi:cell division protein FtsB